MKRIWYEYDDMKKVGKLLERLTVSGMDNIRILAAMGNILDSGTVEDIEEEKEK